MSSFLSVIKTGKVGFFPMDVVGQRNSIVFSLLSKEVSFQQIFNEVSSESTLLNIGKVLCS